MEYFHLLSFQCMHFCLFAFIVAKRKTCT